MYERKKLLDILVEKHKSEPIKKDIFVEDSHIENHSVENRRKTVKVKR